MYKIRGNLFCKIFAVIVFTISVLSFVASIVGFAWLYSNDAYTANNREKALSNAMDSIGLRHTFNAGVN